MDRVALNVIARKPQVGTVTWSQGSVTVTRGYRAADVTDALMVSTIMHKMDV